MAVKKALVGIGVSPIDAGKVSVKDSFFYLGIGQDEAQDPSVMLNMRRVTSGAPRSWMGWE